MTDENNELGKIIQSFRDGNYNVSEGAKMLNDEQVMNLKSQLDIQEGELNQLR